MQRCFYIGGCRFPVNVVFSAHAEMFPHKSLLWRSSFRFLCTCRDVSTIIADMLYLVEFSLHMQRCFQGGQGGDWQHRVFSAHAEMFLSQCFCIILDLRFLCTCRDVSGRGRREGGGRFGFLCTCRDVSERTLPMLEPLEFSLHMQRCFYQRLPSCPLS